jgi:hypothetical protein
MAEKKSIVENAILDIEMVQKALNANTKEILRSVAREEIDGMVKESLEEDLYEEEVIDDESEAKSDEAVPTGDDESDDDDDEAGDDDESDDDDDEADDAGADVAAIDADDSDDVMGAPEVGSDDDQEMGMGMDDMPSGDEIDMTDASDEDVIAIYKKLSGDDEIEVVGDEIHLNISEPGEYIVKKGALESGEEMDENMDEEMYENMDEEMYENMDENSDESMVYEIAIDEEEESNEEYVTEEEESNEEYVTEEEETNEEEIKEAIPVGSAQAKRVPGKAKIGQPRGAGAKDESVNESVSKKLVSETEIKYKKLLTETEQLKKENDEFRQALKKFRGMLVETVVFNSNLSYVTKLFMEHSTTKEEKKKIIQRFDNEVTNLKESKKLYKTIASELIARKPINESIENKIIKEVSTSSSKKLNEATAYVDPSTQRIKDLINRVENKDKY